MSKTIDETLAMVDIYLGYALREILDFQDAAEIRGTNPDLLASGTLEGVRRTLENAARMSGETRRALEPEIASGR